MGLRNPSTIICLVGLAVLVILNETKASIAISPSSGYTAADTGSSQAPTPSPRYETLSTFLKDKKEIFRTLAFLGLSFFISGSIQILHYFWKKRKVASIDELLPFNVSFGDEFGISLGPKDFSYVELCKATNNFDDQNKLGEGGFGAVYGGLLNETDVAVKRFSRNSKQGIKEFMSEVNIISQLRHKNLVKLIGWCHEEELLLVYELMPNGSLDSHLFKARNVLPWKCRCKIVRDLASALLYLHEEGDFCVLHRDIKTSNVLLDSNFSARLGDFGLARLVEHEKGALITQLAGTWGYMAPECHTTGRATRESDVYSFGVVILEIVCGRRSIEHNYAEDQVSLVAWVWEVLGNKNLLDIVDKKLGEDVDLKELECLIMVGLWCAHPARSMRPSIRQANHVLQFEAPFPDLSNKMHLINCDHMASASVVRTSSEPCLSYTSITIPR